MSTEKTPSKLGRDGSLLFISTLVVNAGNYGINLLLGRWLGPSDFSEVSLLVTLLLMLSFWALAFQLTAAKYVAEYTNEAQTVDLAAILAWLHRLAMYVGIGLLVLLLGVAFFLKVFFQMHSPAIFVIFALSLPLYLLMSLNRGILQGQGQYKKLALTYQVEMWTRLVLSVVLVQLGFGVWGVAWGLSLSIFVTWLYSKEKISFIEIPKFGNKKNISFFLTVLIYECSQILINNSDTVLVKHYFPPQEAGLYAALALIGRIVYFGTWTVVTLLFPLVIKLKKEGKNPTKYFYGGLAAVGSIATIIILACFLFPQLMVNLLFGVKYLSIAPYLWQYALATSLFALVNVFVYYNMSFDKKLPVWLTIVGGVLQIILISIFHQTFLEVIYVQIYLMLALFVVMVLYQFFSERETHLSTE